MLFVRPVLIGLILTAMPLISSADPIVDAAQKEVDDAEEAVEKARNRLSRLRNAVPRNESDRDQLKKDLQDATRQLDEVQQQLPELERDARDTREKFGKAKSDQVAAGSAVARAKKELNQNIRAVEDAKKEAIKIFERDPSTLELQSAVNEKKLAVENELTRVDINLRKTQPYGDLRSASDNDAEALKQLRETPGTDPNTLIGANQKWMDSRNKADAVLNRACDGDKKYIESVELLAAARKAQTDAIELFKRSLSDRPEIVILIQAADQSKADVIRTELEKKQLDSALREAEIASGKAESKHRKAADSLDTLRSKREQTAIDLKDNESQRDRLDRDINLAIIQLREAEIRLQQARQRLVIAKQRAK